MSRLTEFLYLPEDRLVTDGPAHIPGSAEHIGHPLLGHREDRGQAGELVSFVTFEETVVGLVLQDLLTPGVLSLQPGVIQNLHRLPVQRDISDHNRSICPQIPGVEVFKLSISARKGYKPFFEELGSHFCCWDIIYSIYVSASALLGHSAVATSEIARVYDTFLHIVPSIAMVEIDSLLQVATSEQGTEEHASNKPYSSRGWDMRGSPGQSHLQ